MSKKHIIKPVDRDLQRAINNFAADYGVQWTEEFTSSLCKHLQEEGFDLDAVVRYNKGYFEIEE